MLVAWYYRRTERPPVSIVTVAVTVTVARVGTMLITTSGAAVVIATTPSRLLGHFRQLAIIDCACCWFAQSRE